MYFTNDDDAYYDTKRHIYVLKPEFIRDNYAIELKTELDLEGSTTTKTAIAGFLRRASQTLYKFILTHHPEDPEYMTYRLARYEDYRPIILEALGELVYFQLLSRNDTSIQTGMNMRTGTTYTKAEAFQWEVPLSVQQLLYNNKITLRAKWSYDDEYLNDESVKGIDW